MSCITTKAKEKADMYEPFIDASMATLESLHDLKINGMQDPIAKSDITFQWNDQLTIMQNHGWMTSSCK